MTKARLTLRSSASAAVALALVLWPPIHMVLARSVGFSPWRYAGWGMYATPHPEFLSRVQVVVVPPPDATVRPAAVTGDSESMRLRHFGLLLDVVRDDSIAPLDGTIDVAEARALTRRVRGLRDPGAMRRLAALACGLASGCAATIVFVEEPRLDLRARLTSVQLDAYCVRGTDVRYVGRYRTDREGGTDVWTPTAASCIPVK